MKPNMREPNPEVNSPKESLLDDLLIMVGALVFFLAIIYFGFNFMLGAILERLQPEHERRIFETFVKALPQAENEQQRIRVQQVIDGLTAHWEDAPLAYQSFLLNESSPNAFAFPGGYIGVTTGLLDMAETENELAFVLAHELGHFKHRHHIQGLSQGLSWMIVQAFFQMATGGTVSQNMVFDFFEMFSLRKNQREHETEADEFGLELLAKRYGHTRGAIHFFQKIKGQSAENLKLFEKFTSSHPLPEERIEQLQTWADDKKQNSAKLLPWPPAEKAVVPLNDAGPQPISP